MIKFNRASYNRVQNSNFDYLYSMNHISLRPQFVMKHYDQEVFEKILSTYYMTPKES